MIQPHTSYLICATERSGSSLLCEALTITGVAGVPEEYFSPENEPIWQKRWQISTFGEYLPCAIEQATTSNGVFGAKLMWSYFNHFATELRQLPGNNSKSVAVHDLLQTVFPNLHYILIKRRDKVRQAVSLVRARQTNIWKVTIDSPLDLKADSKPSFSFGQIDYMVQKLEAHEAAWQQYFTANNITPLIVVYEDFVLKYEETAIRLLNHLGISEEARFEEKRLKKQADEESEQWVQRYQYLKMKSKRHQLISHINRVLLGLLQSNRKTLLSKSHPS